jgi:hypothetical protein
VLIERFIPSFDVVERHATVASATPDHAYAVIRRIDLARSVPIRLLVTLRGLAAMTRGRSVRRSWRLDDIIGAGFVLLAEEPGVEVVLGVVGRFWTPAGGLRRVAAQEFVGFDDPGFAKAAWNFRVDPMPDDRVRVSTETRVRCTDDASRRKFLRYWRLIGPFSGFIRSRALALVRAEVERERGWPAGNMANEGGPPA